MTIYTDLSQLPKISTEELKTLGATSGTLKVKVIEVDGYYLPMIHYAPPEGELQLRGFIIDGENILATVELADVTTALEEVLGAPNLLLDVEVPEGTTMH
jgi:hypothetical protein